MTEKPAGRGAPEDFVGRIMQQCQLSAILNGFV
jgi:hypothetical protein